MVTDNDIQTLHVDPNLLNVHMYKMFTLAVFDSCRFYVGISPTLQVSDLDMVKEIMIKHFNTAFTNRRVSLPNSHCVQFHMSLRTTTATE